MFVKYINHCSLLSLKVLCTSSFLCNVCFFCKWVLLFCFGGLVPIGIDMKCSGKICVLYIVLKFVLWYTLFLFCVEFKIVLYQFLYRCGHFNLSLFANQNISDSFLGMYSPVTFAHSLSKKSRTVSSWELCIICQISCDDTLSKASEKGKCTLFKAVGLRKDDVHRRLHDECDSLDLIPTERIQYHRSYTIKINLEKFEPVEAQMNASACVSVRTSESICVKTRSMNAPFDWSQCIFCKQKS